MNTLQESRRTAHQASRPSQSSDGSSFTLPGNIDEESLAMFLGCFGLGLGLAELLMPETVAEIAGLDANPTLLRGFGLREIGTSVGILNASRPAGWLWGR